MCEPESIAHGNKTENADEERESNIQIVDTTRKHTNKQTHGVSV